MRRSSPTSLRQARVPLKDGLHPGVFKPAMIRSLFLSALLLVSARAQEAPLFNGKDLTGWTTGDGKPVTAGWVVEADGVLHRASAGGDIFTAQEYGDYELTWEWKISPGGNCGLKYRVMQYPGKGYLGCEYQLLDDAKHPDGKIGPHRQTASLYDILPPAADKPLKPVGEWNTSKIIVKGNTFEHWLNGTKVLSVDLTSETFKAARAKSKFKAVANFAENPKGRIMIQDHQDEAWFRNIKIKPL
jgi:Domain of Unknown Function (DUF1080)